MSIKRVFAAALACAVFAGGAVGQEAKYPFPQDVVYPNGHMPTGITSAKAQSWYDSWKSEVQVPTSKGLMPTADDKNQVKVEGMGWALIAAAYMGDKESFDGMYKFYKWACGLSNNSGGMMSWKVDSSGIYGNNNDNAGTASDGDLDVAFGLVVANWQWGGDYLAEAQRVIANCKKLIVACEGLSVVAGGYNGGAWGGSCNSYTDISYYTPAFFKIFAEVTSDPAWTKLAEDTYTHLERNAHPTTGIVSGWQNVGTGAAMMGPGGTQNDSSYNHDASRVPWRIALDYLWNGEPRAKAWAAKITNWAYGYGINNLKEGHNRDGTAVSDTPAGFAFLGGFAAGSMANDSAAVRTAFENAIASRDDKYWYSRSTGNMYLLAITGNMWNEELVGGDGFRLTATVDGGGIVRRDPNKTRYASGEAVKLTAEPDVGWNFVEWTGEVASGDAKNPEITVTMDAAKSVTAKFELAGGVNFVRNGDFSEGSDGLDHWTLNTWDVSQGSASVSNGAVTITITNLGAEIHNLQLVQASLPLLEGRTYVVSFDAYASAPRTIEVMSQMAADPWSGYFSEDIELTTEPQAFQFEFTMEHASDDKARIGFNVGQSMESVTISNVSVTFKPSSVYHKISAKAFAKNSGLKVTAKKSAISVKFKAKGSGATELRIYGLKGNLLDKVRMQTVAGRSYAHTFGATKLPNGFYVVTLRNGGVIEQARIVMPK
ncbi:MAG: carbohydrate binding domain-containing protein [Chitinispirillales bacterium]|nr:carbohydrate binding domain-containing protein [Chitinispirillales bacterium]